MNRVMLIGRLTAKPELRYTGSNLPFARFSVAVNRTFNNAQGQRETDFINVVVWRKQAENVCNFLNKGSLVSVEGRLQTGSYDDKDGNKRKQRSNVNSISSNNNSNVNISRSNNISINRK